MWSIVSYGLLLLLNVGVELQTNFEPTHIWGKFGTNVKLPCNSTAPDDTVEWIFEGNEVDSAYPKEICADSVIMREYRDKYSLDTASNLIVLNAVTEDEGYYRCTDNGGFGEKHYVMLQLIDEGVVLEPTTLVKDPAEEEEEEEEEEDSTRVIIFIAVASTVVFCMISLLAVFCSVKFVKSQRKHEKTKGQPAAALLNGGHLQN